MMLAEQLILPSTRCQPLGHLLKQRLKQPGPGTYEWCATCTIGYGMALEQFNGDEQMADEFVQELRRG
jgi:hypothetical protein